VRRGVEGAPEWLVDLLYGPTAPQGPVYVAIVVAGLVVGLLAWRVEWDEELVRETANWTGPPVLMALAVKLVGGPGVDWLFTVVVSVLLGGGAWLLAGRFVRDVVAKAYSE
jgi:hypothetical protein